MATLVTAAVFPSGHATAASLDRPAAAEVRTGTFAGARFRLPLGSGPARARPQLGLTFAPMLRSQGVDGRVRMRFGEGVGVGFSDPRSQLMLGGIAMNERASAAQEEASEKKDSTGKKVLKGAAVVAIVAVAVVGGFLLAYSIACADNRCSE